MSERTLAAHALRRVAVTACCDPRTVSRVLRNEHVLALTRERVVRALKAEGYGHLVAERDASRAGAQ
jgi:DNA-binding LacI/PurR family transcriptional regulator